MIFQMHVHAVKTRAWWQIDLACNGSGAISRSGREEPLEGDDPG